MTKTWNEEIESKNVQEQIDELVEKTEEIKKKFFVYIETDENFDKDSVYFRDGQRKIDFVLVYRLTNQTENNKFERYISNLKSAGLEIEHELGILDKNLGFLKVHGPYKLLLQTAYINNIDLMFESVSTLPYTPLFKMNIMHSELTRPKPTSELLTRAPEAVRLQRPTTLTSAERIIIVYTILKKTKFGDLSYEFGVDALKKYGHLASSYPIHDSPFAWTEKGPLSDRQLLAQFWARPSIFYKVQPYDLINKYYGPEIALYFNFLGYYTKSLIFPAILGILCQLFGVITFDSDENYRSQEICNSDFQLCPSCNNLDLCKYQALKNFCGTAKYGYLLDNQATFVYAIVMCFWARYFINSWKSLQSELMYKWNLTSMELDISMRPDFPANTKYRRISKVTGEIEPYVPLKTRFLAKSISVLSIFFLSLILGASVIGVIVYRLSISMIIIRQHAKDKHVLVGRHLGLFATITSSLLGFIFLVLFEVMYEGIATWLTQLENPRTQADYDKSYVYKYFVFCFLNGYAMLFYISFVKGKLYTYPSDDNQFIINFDSCSPTGCVVDTSLQLFFILLGKSLLKSAIEIGRPMAIEYMKKNKRKGSKIKNLPMWEQAYCEAPIKYHFLIFDYKEVVLQFGYLTLFAATFPLAPVIALFYNVIEVRVDAFKLTKIHRRPVPVRVEGIGAWNGILNILTFIGVATNVFMIAFSTNFVPYMIKNIDSTFFNAGFIDYTLSKFAVRNYTDPIMKKDHPADAVCYYLGKRNKPDHAEPYMFNSAHWHQVGACFLTVIVIEFFVFVFTGLLSYLMPDQSANVRDRILYREHKERIQKQLELDPNSAVIKFE